MPELRKDPISGRWVIISIERGKSVFHQKKVGSVLFVKGMNILLHQKFLLSDQTKMHLIPPAGVSEWYPTSFLHCM